MTKERKTPEQVVSELQALVAELQVAGRMDLLLKAIGASGLEELKIEAARNGLSRLRITRDYRFLLMDRGNQEIDLQPVHKAVYLLFLAHPEGIEFKHLADYREELTTYYMRTARMMDKQRIEEGVAHLVDPFDNAINEKCSRIKSVINGLMDEYSACYYIISNHTRKHINNSSRIWYERLKVITLPRELVVMDE